MKRFDFRKISLVLIVFATFFFSCVVIACDQRDLDCPPTNDCPVCAAYQELSSGDCSTPLVAVCPLPYLIAASQPVAKSGFLPEGRFNHISSRAPPSIV